jgi:hypothetical protein
MVKNRFPFADEYLPARVRERIHSQKHIALEAFIWSREAHSIANGKIYS